MEIGSNSELMKMRNSRRKDYWYSYFLFVVTRWSERVIGDRIMRRRVSMIWRKVAGARPEPIFRLSANACGNDRSTYGFELEKTREENTTMTTTKDENEINSYFDSFIRCAR